MVCNAGMMPSTNEGGVNRRRFLKQTGLSVLGLTVASGMLAAPASPEDSVVSILLDPDDKVASSPPSRWAVNELQAALQARGMTARIFPNLESVPASELCIVAASGGNRIAKQILESHSLLIPDSAESLVLVKSNLAGRNVLLACGSDVRGLVYAVLELADRVRHADEPLAALEIAQPIIEKPANVIRSIARCFVSETEDNSWFNNRVMWTEYLSMLAAQRFNRFSLTFGIAYNNASGVSDSYFLFAYPFLLPVPGYDVRAAGITDSERDNNLAMLKFISDEAAARGLDFQLGLWTHSYDWPNSPRANHPIQGLTPEMHAPYCRDALAALLKACPAINGLTLRVHGESGVPDGSFDFWQTLFEAVKNCGRRVEIDMHAKGVPQKMNEIALATGMPVNLSPKYWAEHMGLPYHQAAIRELEMAHEPYQEAAAGIGTGSRNFMRYGYGDLLTEDRPYGVLHRIWPGTRRFLLSGDPATAAGFGRNASFCGSLGVELFEPLSFKGRKGSGIAGGRCAYADKSLELEYDWQKYLYTYRVWGRLTYNPDTDPEVWRRLLRKELPGAYLPMETALANSSRILPLITTAHGASANNSFYWPEIYTNMSIPDPNVEHPYNDTPSPKRFGTVSPFDPQLFSTVDEFAGILLAGQASGKHSPLEVAQWLEDLANAAATNLSQVEKTTESSSPAFRRLSIDVSIQSGLGLFFAWKMRSALLWSLFDHTGDSTALVEALNAYRKARAAWAGLAACAKAAYVSDITYGNSKNLGGHWLDRLPAIDEDIAKMEQQLKQPKPVTSQSADPDRVQQMIRAVSVRPMRPAIVVHHTPAAHFQPGTPLEITLLVEKADALQVRLQYRHVNQAERWQVQPMESKDGNYRATIPADYTRSRFPLQYYFEITGTDGLALYPGFDANLSNLPYFVLRAMPKSR